MIDHVIDHAHRQADAMERDAKAIDDRMRSAGVPADWLNRRRGMGQLRNPYGTTFNNLSVRAILEQRDRALAIWLAQREGVTVGGIDYQAQERARQQADAVARLQERTAQLRVQNQARRQQLNREATYGRRDRFTGSWV